MSLRESTCVTSADVERLMQLVDRECRWADDVRFAATNRYFDVSGPAPDDFDAMRLETEAHEFRDALARNDIDTVRDRLPRYAEQIGVRFDHGSLDERILGRTILRAFAEASERTALELRGPIASITASVDDAPTLNDHPAFSQPSQATSPQNSGSRRKPQDRFAGLTVEQLWQLFAQKQVTTKKWRQAVANQSLGTVRAWTKAVGVASPEEIRSAVASEFRRVMLRLPGDYAKSKRWRDLSFAEILTLADGTSYRPLTVSTWNRHQSAMTAFWYWLSRNELTNLTKNPFDGLWVEADEDLDPMEGGSSKRPMWSADQLVVLLESPLFVGCKSSRRRSLPGDLLIRDSAYWVVLIIALTGMRREEVCALRVCHVETDPATGIVFFNLKAPGLRLKNPESRRWIPLPKLLLALGFVEMRLAGRTSEEHVFSELQGKKNFGDKVGKFFVGYRRKLGLYEPLLDLHAFRHTVSTLLIRAGVPQAHAEELTGHRSDARRTAFAIYDKGATLRILQDAINRLEMPLEQALRAHASYADGGCALGDLTTYLPSAATMEVPT